MPHLLRLLSKNYEGCSESKFCHCIKEGEDRCGQRHIFNNNSRTTLLFDVVIQHIKAFIVSRNKVLYASIIEGGKLARMLRHLPLFHRHQNAGFSRIASSARRRGLLSDGVILLHGNDMSHSTRVTQQLVQSFD
ncbi:hypothetical protein AVEN_200451-1 [Araneus ventricosus]|uniref:Uncharacterized protein n=1 Tax=Araneus ventricosus TaxID=182803 RepID=A0A4Y2JHL9_ARAVE|nr:hypothetical protein AVEN_200451-1 [Araneus ventricosus]